MLRILSVRKSDSGEYTVLLTNKKGSEKSSAKVVVTSDGELHEKAQSFIAILILWEMVTLLRGCFRWLFI